MVWHAEKPPCVDSKRPRVYRHHARMCQNMRALCRYTRGRFESTHGGVLDRHTGRGGGEGREREFCLPRLVHVVITCSRGSPKETTGCYPFKV